MHDYGNDNDEGDDEAAGDEDNMGKPKVKGASGLVQYNM